MNPSVIKRIESINKGIVPESYKKTKVGSVAVEWEPKSLAEVLKQSIIITLFQRKLEQEK